MGVYDVFKNKDTREHIFKIKRLALWEDQIKRNRRIVIIELKSNIRNYFDFDSDSDAPGVPFHLTFFEYGSY